MDSPSDLSRYEDLSCRISKQPPGIVKMPWPRQQPSIKLPNIVGSSVSNEIFGNRNEAATEYGKDTSPLRKKKYLTSQRKTAKSSIISPSIQKKQAQNNDMFKLIFTKLTNKAKLKFASLTSKIKRRRFLADFGNLKSYHFELIKDLSSAYFTSEKEKRGPIVRKIFGIYSYFLHLPALMALTKYLKTLLKKASQHNRLNINPNSPFKILWDLVFMFLITIQLFFFSIEKCFSVSFGNSGFEKFLLFAFYFDLFICVNTKIFRDGLAITNRMIIVKDLFSKKLISVIVPCLCVSFAGFSENGSLDYLKLALLIKIIKTRKLSQRLRDLIVKSREADALYQLLILFTFIFCWAHVIAILWHLIGSSAPNLDSSNWLATRGIQKEDWKTKYVYSIYWGLTTMLTVGYGDITPTNISEMLYNIFAMFLGCCIFGYTMNKIGEILNYYQRNKNYLDDEMSKVRLLLQGKKIPYETQTKIKRYLSFVWKQEQKEDPQHENFIMNKLSSELRNEIYLHTNVRNLRAVPALKTFSEKTLIALARKMTKVCFSPEEFVFKEGDFDNPCIYFTLDGNLRMVTAKDDKILTVWRSFKKGDHFGDREIFTGTARTLSVVSFDFSTLFKLPRSDIIQVLKKFPDEYEKFCQIKDLDLLYDLHHQYDKSCFSCGYKDHALEKCSFLKYNPNQKVIIHKFLSKIKLRAKTFKRRNIPSHHAMMEKHNISSAQAEFLSLYEDDEDLRELIELYGLEHNKKTSILIREKNNQRQRHHEADEHSPGAKPSANQKNQEFTFTRWMRKNERGTTTLKKIASEKRLTEVLPITNENGLQENSELTSSSESHETNKRKTEISKKIPTHDSYENNTSMIFSHRSHMGINHVKQCDSKHDLFQSVELMRDEESKRTVFTSREESHLSTKHIVLPKEQNKELKAANHAYPSALMDVVKVYKFYFPHNNVNELNLRRKTLKFFE